MFSHKTEEICPIFGAPVNFFLLYFVTQITQITQIFSTAISCHADFFAVFFSCPTDFRFTQIFPPYSGYEESHADFADDADFRPVRSGITQIWH